ncbi:SPX domain-containing protein [Cymbomonas tetramitiformis]|uniref:SPX domain-containing protein n=1 Tax=Cymbomonas tetramitiformis TaxID=36881 RepID=A0AAE0LB79_9CHLO|nr:SPX domain-containing protein [Cymbomonas tetramitiformis]
MKFGKNLQLAMMESLPEYRDKFLSYKQLKKILKSVPPASERPTQSSERDETGSERPSAKPSDEERHFIVLLNEDLQTFNNFFMEKEEEYVMQLASLQEKLAQLEVHADPVELKNLQSSFVQFHGALVLLQHWSSLNYAALVKILKKHDKHSQLTLRSRFLANALNQPFYNIDVLQQMVDRVENLVKEIGRRLAGFDAHEESAAEEEEQAQFPLARFSHDELEADTDLDNLRRTQAALELWAKVRSKSIPVPDKRHQLEDEDELDDRRPSKFAKAA